MHVLEKGCETTLWRDVSVRYSLVSRRPKNSCSHTHTHTQVHIYTYTYILCLELRAPVSTKEQGCFMCVWLSLFQLDWNSRSLSESLRNDSRDAWTRCVNSSQTFCGCSSLSEHVCPCLMTAYFCWNFQPLIDLFSTKMKKTEVWFPAWGETVSVLVILPVLALGFITPVFCLELCFPCRCVLIQHRLNQQIGMTLNVCVLTVWRCPLRRVFAC